MKQTSVFLFYLVAVIISACSGLPTVSPAVDPIATRSQPTKPTATRLVAVTISQAVVNVRETAGGERTGEYVYSGDKVTLSGKCIDDWCPISKPIKGWIWRGCIEELADGLLCQTKP